MKRLVLFFIFLYPALAFGTNTNAIFSTDQYNRMEPYLTNEMRRKLKPVDAEYTTSTNQKIIAAAARPDSVTISNFANTSDITKPTRRVVTRARSGTSANVSRAGTVPRARSVIARPRSAIVAAQNGVVNQPRSSGSVVIGSEGVTPEQCLANYTSCMDDYCERANTKYNRCYCSAKLAQIDAEYKPAIDQLLNEIIALKNGGSDVDQDEINDYWDGVFGETGENSMENLDNALNIDWAGTQNSARGQNAFVTGDSFCKQQLTKCFYMSENLKSMYRTTIGQDCKSYETYLKKLKSAAEQVVEGYN